MPGKSIPTPNELMVLRLLWKQGPLTVREIRDQISPRKKFAYTTVLTIVHVLTKKGWLTRKRVGKADQYWPEMDEAAGKRFILQELADRLFDGSLAELGRFAGSGQGRIAATPAAAPPVSPHPLPVTQIQPKPEPKPAPKPQVKPEPKPPKRPMRLPVQHLDVDLL